MNTVLVRCSALLMILFSSSSLAQLREYRIDPEHSRVIFRVDHLGLSHSTGMFARLKGLVRFDDSRWDLSQVEVDIPLDSLYLGDDGWQRKVLDDYLHADRHTLAHFRSTGMARDDSTPGKDGFAATLHGSLTLNGISRAVTLRMRYNGDQKSLYTRLKRKVGFSAQTSIKRSEFGLDKQLDQVGDEINLTIEIEAIEKRRR